MNTTFASKDLRYLQEQCGVGMRVGGVVGNLTKLRLYIIRIKLDQFVLIYNFGQSEIDNQLPVVVGLNIRPTSESDCQFLY